VARSPGNSRQKSKHYWSKGAVTKVHSLSKKKIHQQVVNNLVKDVALCLVINLKLLIHQPVLSRWRVRQLLDTALTFMIASRYRHAYSGG